MKNNSSGFAMLVELFSAALWRRGNVGMRKPRFHSRPARKLRSPTDIAHSIAMAAAKRSMRAEKRLRLVSIGAMQSVTK